MEVCEMIHDRFILAFAFRYALGRESTAPSIVAEALVEHKDLFQEWERAQIVSEIRQAIEEGKAGDTRIDIPVWRKVISVFEAQEISDDQS